jgi:hypothetical protein
MMDFEATKEFAQSLVDRDGDCFLEYCTPDNCPLYTECEGESRQMVKMAEKWLGEHIETLPITTEENRAESITVKYDGDPRTYTLTKKTEKDVVDDLQGIAASIANQFHPVDKPAHYAQGKIECIDAIQEALTPEEFAGFCKGNVLKYVWRERRKNGIEDCKKARYYLDRLIKAKEANNG